MNTKRLDKVIIKVETIYLILITLYLIVLYAFFDYRLVITLLFVPILTYYFISRRKKLTIFLLWNSMFILLSGLSFFWSSYPEQTLIDTRIMFEIAVISNLLIAFIDKENKLESTYKIFVIAGFALIIRLIYEVPIENWFDGRLRTEDLNSNEIGLFTTISAIFAFYFAAVKKKKFSYILLLIFSFVVFLTGSRKAFFMLILGIALLYYFSQGRKISKKLSSIIIGIIIVFLGYFTVMNIPYFYQIIGIRIESLLSLVSDNVLDVDNSVATRRNMIEVGLHLFKYKPILGYGLGSYSVISGFDTYSHNNYIELLVGLGVIGTTIYYSMIFYILFKLYKKREFHICNPLLVLLILFIFNDLALVSYKGFVYQYLIAIGFVATRIVGKINENNKRKYFIYGGKYKNAS